MNKSETIIKLIPALIRAKKNFAPAVKAKKNDFFKSKYVPLDTVIDVTEDALCAEGLTVIHTTTIGLSCVHLLTTLVHDSGEFIESDYPLKPVKDDPQGNGSAMTYARRYCLMAILGIAPEDDDGNAASGNATPAVTFRTVKEAKPTMTTTEVNSAVVAAGGEPVMNMDDKAAAAESYKRLFALNKDKAKAIKHNRGTDWEKMKSELDVAYREEIEGAAQ